MVADRNMIVDGQEYEKGEEIWDLGSLQCIEKHGNKREYQGFLSDKLKLPKYDDLGTGSSATLIDPTGAESTLIGRYDAPTKTWYDLKGGVIV